MPEFPNNQMPSNPSGAGFLSPELLLAAIVDSSDDAIVSKNLQGIVTSWNRAAERIFGYTAEEMIGQPILKLLPDDRKAEETVILERLRAGDRVDHFETIRVRKDGRIIDVSLTISPLRDQSGKVVGASKIARDITEQRRSARALVEAHDALQRADRMKSEFISTLSHELRTPLSAIGGWIQILETEATPEELAQGLEVIKRNVRVQTQLIDDLLDMSRIEAGKLTLDVQKIDLPTIVAAAIESVRPAAHAKDIRVTTAFSSIEGVIMADRNRMQQIIFNLLTNAIKFTPKSGRVHVVIERVNSHVEVAITDSGAGIPSEFLPHIFERFSQADSTITRRHGGLGLGLAIVKHLTELHGGTVAATSEGEGKGSTFIIKLPLIPVRYEAEKQNCESGDQSKEQPTKVHELEGVKILTVDDDPDSVEIVRRILTRSGAEVRTATSVDSALAEFQKFVPHIVLSDIGMPGRNGYDLITCLRELPNGRSVPAIALTALARSEDRTRAVRAGYQVHLAKPVDAVELVAIVRNLARLQSDRRDSC